jgi:hypothetical protein
MTRDRAIFVLALLCAAIAFYFAVRGLTWQLNDNIPGGIR